jgi:Protein of unknown function (DUF3592)
MIVADKTPSKIGASLFGAIFFAFGFGFFFAFVGSSLIDRLSMQNWQPAQAQILTNKLERHHGDDTTTYKAIANYRFTFQGVSYQGDRVSLHTSADNFGSYHEDKNRELGFARSQNKNIRVWVNPDNPYDSVIDRDIRWFMIIFPAMFCSIFMLIGGGIIYLTWRKKKPNKPDTVLSQGDKPWLAKPEWSATGIVSNNKIALWAWWFGTLFVNTIALPILFQLPAELSKGNYGILIALIFNAIGFFVLYKAVQKTLEQLRFGRVPVLLTPFPGELGGKVAGHLDFQQRLDNSSTFYFTLKQMKTVTTRSGGKTQTSTTSTWDLTGNGTLKTTINGSRIYFAFEVPANLKPSRTDDNNGYWWSLEVKGDMPGVDFNRSYEIPVFKTTSSALNSVSQPSDVSTATAQTDFSEQLEAMLDIEQLTDGILIRQAPGKQKMAWPIALFGVIFGGVGIGIGITDAPLLFPIVFSAFGLLFAGIGINMLITGYETYIDKDGVSHKVFRLGSEKKHNLWPRSTLRGLCMKLSGSSSSGAKTVEYFDILLQQNYGHKINISSGIAGRQAASQLLDSLSILTSIKVVNEYKSRLQIKKEQQRT